MTSAATQHAKVGNSAIEVGRFTYGHENLVIRQWNEGASLRIGSFCSIATQITVFLGGNHRTDWITTFPFGYVHLDDLGTFKPEGTTISRGDIVIGNDVWIGHGVTILSGVSIGSGAALAANATVTRDVEPYEVVGGNPATPLKKRFAPEIIELLLELSWWDLPVEVIKEIAPQLSQPPSAALLRELIAHYRTR